MRRPGTGPLAGLVRVLPGLPALPGLTGLTGLFAPAVRSWRHGEAAAGRRREGLRLRLPAALSAPLGYDAVGVAAGLGPRIRRTLPRTGCVFTDAERWWWIVPAEADIGVVWPSAAHYATGAYVTVPGAPDGRPRLTHWPEDDVPYTHPVMLYIAVCNAVGLRPDWSGRAPVKAHRTPAPGPGPLGR